jgi:hypothetical protein
MADLVLMATTMNDSELIPSLQPEPSSPSKLLVWHEMFVRRLLKCRTFSGAIVYSYSGRMPQRGSKGYFQTQEYQSIVADYYGLPSVSYRDAVLPVLEKAEKLPRCKHTDEEMCSRLDNTEKMGQAMREGLDCTTSLFLTPGRGPDCAHRNKAHMPYTAHTLMSKFLAYFWLTEEHGISEIQAGSAANRVLDKLELVESEVPSWLSSDADRLGVKSRCKQTLETMSIFGTAEEKESFRQAGSGDPIWRYGEDVAGKCGWFADPHPGRGEKWGCAKGCLASLKQLNRNLTVSFPIDCTAPSKLSGGAQVKVVVTILHRYAAFQVSFIYYYLFAPLHILAHPSVLHQATKGPGL